MDENLNPMEQQPEISEAPAAEPVAAPAADPVLEENLRFIDEQINDNWLEEFLQKKQAEEPEKEIGADPLAVAAAGLVAPEDRELEEILAEHRSAEEPQVAKAEEAFPVEEELPIAFDEPAPEQEEEIPEYAEDEFVDDTEEAEEEYEEEFDDSQKRRPKMNKDGGFLGILYGLPHVVVTLIWIAIIVMIAVPLGRLGWLYVADVMAFGKEQQSVTLTITQAEVDNGDLDSISQKLADAGIVRYPKLFKTFAELTGKGERIDAGTYTLGTHLDYNALLNNMQDFGPVMDVVTIMFPEGYNCAQIFAKLEEEGVCSVQELEEYAANGELSNYWFLEGVERGHKYCLEGYLAPNTYQFYTNDEPGRVLEKFLDAFDASFTDKMHENLVNMQERYKTMLMNNGYGRDYIESHPLTLHKVITLASIVQKETANDNESFTIASVFYNRLTNPGNHPYLGSDATVYYAIGDYFGEKDELTQADLDFDSPYNTRNHQGLPPGPICNPGMQSIYAALEPDRTDYYYFVYSTEDRKHLFSSTLREHEDKLKALGLW